MYSFLQEGEFVQLTVEEAGRVTGFISCYGELDSDRGQFLDLFFKSGKLDGKDLSSRRKQCTVCGTTSKAWSNVDRERIPATKLITC